MDSLQVLCAKDSCQKPRLLGDHEMTAGHDIVRRPLAVDPRQPERDFVTVGEITASDDVYRLIVRRRPGRSRDF